jgi:hypothetical protein
MFVAIAFIVSWAFLGSFLFDYDISTRSILFSIAVFYLGDVISPLVRVIICNYRKVPYHGEAGSDQRS